MTKLITVASEAWNLLNGVACLYKPAGESYHRVRRSFLTKLCQELNEFEDRPPSSYVSIEGDTTKEMSVTVRPNYADNPLVVGPRYQSRDFKAVFTSLLGFNTSGVFALGINAGCRKALNIQKSHPLRTYRLKGTFGYVTDNLFKTGKIVGEAKFRHVRQGGIEKHLSMIQASHQRLAYESAGVDPQSQEAYELAARGLVRPKDSKVPIIYGAKLIDFEPPNFTIELSCINEYEDYLLAQLHAIGERLHSAATCTSIQCIHHSFFKLEDALLKKHWTLKEVVHNLANNNRLIRKQGKLTNNLNEYVAKQIISQSYNKIVDEGNKEISC